MINAEEELLEIYKDCLQKVAEMVGVQSEIPSHQVPEVVREFLHRQRLSRQNDATVTQNLREEVYEAREELRRLKDPPREAGGDSPSEVRPELRLVPTEISKSKDAYEVFLGGQKIATVWIPRGQVSWISTANTGLFSTPEGAARSCITVRILSGEPASDGGSDSR